MGPAAAAAAGEFDRDQLLLRTENCRGYKIFHMSVYSVKSKVSWHFRKQEHFSSLMDND
jgi:hypothetical protein